MVAISRFPIHPKDVFLTVINMLEENTQADFTSRMDRARSSYYGPNNLVITINSVDPNVPMFRRYLMWATLRIMESMRSDPRVGYRATFFESQWQGQKVGEIRFTFTVDPRTQPQLQLQSSNDSTITTTTTIPLPPATHINATTQLGADPISWIYEPLDIDTLTQWDIARSTMGALVEAASLRSNIRFEQFISLFADSADAYCYYNAESHPSRLTKGVIIKTLAAAAKWALQDGELRPLGVRVLLFAEGRTLEVAHGGYV